jgi:hypothetical protein
MREFLQSWHGHVICLLQCLLLPFFSSNPFFGWLDFLPSIFNPRLFFFRSVLTVPSFFSPFRSGEKPNDNWESKLKNHGTQWLKDF